MALEVPGGADDFGAKSIGMVGSIAILLNNILGPGIANFPGLYQQAGWFPPSLTIFLCVASSLFSGEMLIAAMRAMPGNSNFEKRVEFGTLCRHYFPRRLAILYLAIFQLAMFMVNIVNIIQTAQVFDDLFDTLFGDSCAMDFFPKHHYFFCHTDPEDVTPFGPDGRVLLSLGMLAVAVLSIPLGYWNLDDNVHVQNAALVIIVACMFVWGVVFLSLGIDPKRVEVVGTTVDNMGGIILFNFMFIATIPSWACEKSPSVSAFRAISMTLLAAIVCYLIVGVLGGMAFATYWQNSDNNLLSELYHISVKDLPVTHYVAFVTVEAYAVAANMASIPVFSIIMRYNLVESGLFGRRMASAVAVLLPFACAVVLYAGKGFASAVTFAGTFTSSIVNLIVPSLLFLAAQRQVDERSNNNNLTSSCTVEGQAVNGDSARIPTVCGLASAAICLRPEGQKWSRAWRIIAWANLAFMTLFTTVSIIDLLVPGSII